MMKAIPGDPFTQEELIPEEVLRSLKAHYGFDKPVWQQYVHYITSLLQGDLGPSFKYEGRTVNQIIKDGGSISFLIGILTLFISIPTGVLLGTIAAFGQGKLRDRCILFFVTFTTSVPGFIKAVLLQYFFAVWLSVLPIAKWGSPAHMVLPVLSLSLMPIGLIARLVRSQLCDILQKDHILTAKMKGLNTMQIAFFHALPLSILPLLSYLPPLCTQILTGSFVIERIFAIPGLGGWFISAVLARDYTVIMGLSLFYGAMLTLATTFFDLLIFFFNPKMRRNIHETA